VYIERKRISVLFIDLFLQKSFFGLLFLCFFPPEHSKKMKNKILYSERERERTTRKKHKTSEWGN
jgi:hypothetical protein